MNQHFVPRQKMLIDGELIESESGAWLTSIDPATEGTLGEVPLASSRDVGRAVEAAQRAQPAWAALEAMERAALLRKVAAGMRARGEEILRTEVTDTGNTISKMAADVEQATVAIEYFAGLGGEIKGESYPASSKNIHISLREPYGVVGRIVPFNHPIKFAAHALAAPLMAGNTVVVKPPEQSPLSSVILGEICRDALPKGVVNIVSGPGLPTGDAIARHPAVKRIAFTGSAQTGQTIQRAAAEAGVKHVTLELGGKNPLIAFPDIPADEVAQVGVAGMNFSWQGQSCGSTSRLLVHESLYDDVVQRIEAVVAKIRLGQPLDPASEMGPINSKRQYDRVCQMVEAGKAGGARLVIGGKRPSKAEFAKGYWHEPTVFADVTADMAIAQEEIFGPVLSILKWKTESEMIDIANSTKYGLTASIWTNDITAALRTARAVKAGYVDQRHLGTFLRCAVRRPEKQRSRPRRGPRRAP
jgi:betaine-aldehyde dehydrogenase